MILKTFAFIFAIAMFTCHLSSTTLANPTGQAKLEADDTLDLSREVHPEDLLSQKLQG